MTENRPGLLKRLFKFGQKEESRSDPDKDASGDVEQVRDHDSLAPTETYAPLAAETEAGADPSLSEETGQSPQEPASTEQESQRELAATPEKDEAQETTGPRAGPQTGQPEPASFDGILGAPGETNSDFAEETPEPVSNTPEPPVTATESPADEAAIEETQGKSWFNRLKNGLARSSDQLTGSLSSVFTQSRLDENTLQDLEDILIRADLGVETAMAITGKLADQKMSKDVREEDVRHLMAQEIEAVLAPVARELELDLDHQPHVVLVVGVNGSGKTTTIGKLAQKLYDAGFSTSLVAGDTFRAAAIEQLKIWGERTRSPVLFRPLGADAASLAFDAWMQAKEDGRDVVLMDTAGRLQNKAELMAELEKIIRVFKKHDAEAPHTVLLTIDATTGQNALNQVEIFKDVAGVNGLVMTKLDGTARGGILVAIAAKYGIPVYFLGVGEQVDDLEPFEARDFARSIAGLA